LSLFIREDIAMVEKPNAEEIWQLYQSIERETGDEGYGSALHHLNVNGYEDLTYSDVVKACEIRRLRRDGIDRIAHHARKLCSPQAWLSYAWNYEMRLRGVKVGRSTYCKGRVDVERNGGNIAVGNRVEFGRYVLLQTGFEGEIIIGNDVQINRFNIISSGNRIEIGDHCVFAPGVCILDSEHSYKKRNLLIKNVPGTSAPVRIGPGCWLGFGVTVLKGVQVGEGAVVGAHSVVKDDIPAYAVSVGAPARVVKFREECHD